jgi:hypothetical protein
MGWGDGWNAAWNRATGKAKQLGSAVGSGWDSTKKWTAQKATQAKSWAVDQGTKAKNWAAQKATNAARAAEKKALQGVEDLGGDLDRDRNDLRKAKNALARKANEARNKVRSIFGKEPVGDACPTCDGKGEPKTDKEADGMYMGAGCKPKKSLDEAKKSAVEPDKENSCCAAKKGPRRKIYYVNGINTPRQAHCDTLNLIANSECAEVIGIYNAHENMALDGMQTGRDRQLINRAAAGHPPQLDGRNPAVDTVSNTVYREIQAGNKPEIWAHSQGGAVTSLGLYSADNRLKTAGNPNGVSGMKVNSFGSAAPRWVDGPQYNHYIHTNDITPVALGLGDSAADARARAGRGAKIHYFSGKAPNGLKDEPQNGDRKGLLTPTSNHNIDSTYLVKHEQDKGEHDCGKTYRALLEKRKKQPAAQRH